jgi:hypothetical protein
MKKRDWIGLAGWTLVAIGLVVEALWRQNPKYANYDNAGPGLFYLVTPGLLLIIATAQHAWRERRQKRREADRSLNH